MDDRYIYYTLLHQLALRAKWICRPNPAVAAVVVKNHKIISWGYTQPVGGPHAEVMAISRLGARARGTDLYVTLMPCCFHNKTPPCTDLIIRSGIKTVHVAGLDNDPRMRIRPQTSSPNTPIGNVAAEVLKKAGVKVVYDCPPKIAEKLFFLNWDYFKRNAVGLPTITMKYAMTLDGKIAGPPSAPLAQLTQLTQLADKSEEKPLRGETKITGKEIDAETHNERAQHDSILVGGNTLRNDNPRLNVRAEEKFSSLPELTMENLLPSGENLTWAKPLFRDRMTPSLRKECPFRDLLPRILQPRALIMTRSRQSPSLYLMKKRTAPLPLFIAPATVGDDFPGQRTVLFSGTGQSKRINKTDPNSWSYEGSPMSKEFWKALSLSREFPIQSIFLEGGAALQSYLWETGLIDRIHVYISPRLFRDGFHSLSPFTLHHSGNSGQLPQKNSFQQIPFLRHTPLLWDLWQTRVMVWGGDIKVSALVNRSLAKKLWKQLFPNQP